MAVPNKFFASTKGFCRWARRRVRRRTMLRLPVSASTGPQSALNLRQPRLAQPIKAMLDILGVLVDGKTFPAFNREPRVDPQHLRGFGSRLLKLSRLRVGGRQHKMRTLLIGQAQYAF